MLAISLTTIEESFRSTASVHISILLLGPSQNPRLCLSHLAKNTNQKFWKKDNTKKEKKSRLVDSCMLRAHSASHSDLGSKHHQVTLANKTMEGYRTLSIDHRGVFCDANNHVGGLGYTLGFGLTSISFTLRTYMASGSWLQNKTTQRKSDENVVNASVCDSKEIGNIRFLSFFKCVTWCYS